MTWLWTWSGPWHGLGPGHEVCLAELELSFVLDCRMWGLVFVLVGFWIGVQVLVWGWVQTGIWVRL